MGSSPADSSAHVDIANTLTIQLVLIGLGAAFVNGLLALVTSPLGSLGYVFVAAANVVVLWLVVQAVFAALDDLLEAKLAPQEE